MDGLSPSIILLVRCEIKPIILKYSIKIDKIFFLPIIENRIDDLLQ